MLSTRADPLRAENPDFDIVGPGWLAVVTFGVGVVLHGMLVAALAARVSRSLPLPAARPKVVLAYSALLLNALFFPIAIAAALIGLLAYLAARRPAAIALRNSGGLRAAGRAAIVLPAIIALPTFASALIDIVRRP